MIRTRKKEHGGAPAGFGSPCCAVDSVMTVGERGQVVLPKELREAAGIRTGDKLAVLTCKEGERVTCLTLVKADQLTELVKNILGPLFRDFIR